MMSERSDTMIVWFRRDLRVVDHPALTDALNQAATVIPLFVLDERLLAEDVVAPARTWFLKRSLIELDRALRVRGSGLLVRSGRPEEVVPAVASEVGARAVIASRDVTPFSYRRDIKVRAALHSDGRQLILRPGLLVTEPGDILAASGDPYAVFTPFWRALKRAPRRALLDAPTRIPGQPLMDARAEDLLAEMGEVKAPVEGLPTPGEAAAQERLRVWASEGISAYGEGRNHLSGDSTSHMGADLHLGLLSPLQVEAATEEAGESATPFVRQLAWLEFYHHSRFRLRNGADRNPDSPFMSIFRSERDDPDAVTAWRIGGTGIPVVDAGMRQLAAAAWLSNRARLVVASFLTRHLLMDYRIGEEHFMRHLIDGDVANNLGGWQWTAGVGSDPQPWFRIFNPVLQGQRFDPEGEWVRRWIPELAAVPARYVHAPWEMPESVAAQAGLRLGVDYPRPIVDLKFGRERALAAFRSVAAIRA